MFHLLKCGPRAAAFSGNQSYTERQDIAIEFMSNDVRMLLTTDLLMRSAFGSANVVMVVNVHHASGLNGSKNKKHHFLQAGRAGQFGEYTLLLDYYDQTIYYFMHKIFLQDNEELCSTYSTTMKEINHRCINWTMVNTRINETTQKIIFFSNSLRGKL